MSGSAGTGKSRANLEKINYCALQYPEMRALIVRKTRESLTESGLFTFERHVLGDDNPICSNVRRNYRQGYIYPNGSEVVVGGMDKPSKIMSTEYDIIYVQEAIELNIEDWESLTTRLRNYKIPYQQLLADTNPAGPKHWLKQRCDSGKTLYIVSRHTDNPMLYNPFTREWTPNGLDYLSKLEDLTGTRRDRLLLGEWKQAEGLVFPNFGEGNLVEEEPDKEKPIELAIDDGYIDPRAILFIQRRPDYILVFDEIYESKRLPEEHIAAIKAKCEQRGWKLPEIAITGSESTELIRRLQKADIPARGGTHKIVEGIALMRSLICDGNGYRAIRVHKGRCPNLIAELSEGYQYPPTDKAGRNENPLDEQNHAVDACRMWCFMRARRG